MMSSCNSFEHEPVMVDVVTDVFGAVPPGYVLDATVGGGGHAAAILAHRADLRILGLDRDHDALSAAQERLQPYGDRVLLVHGRFDDIDVAMSHAGLEELSGALFDLGVSSYQFDRAERGFSYRFDAPLDMRMDRSRGRTAADLVNSESEEELTRILRDYADERFARRIAQALIAARPVNSTSQLADIVSNAIPAPARRRGGHPAKRTFQALRIAVNEELAILPIALDSAITKTCVGGRVAVLSYHSGEDRIVKSLFGHHMSGGCTCPSHLPCVCGARPTLRRVRVPSRPSAEEQSKNRRSSSARLRVVEVI